MLSAICFASSMPVSAQSSAKSAVERYAFDIEGAHAFVQFRIKHLGYSWLYGRFNEFDGEFTFNPADKSIVTLTSTIAMPSIDSNHVKRDKHLRSKDFLDVEKHPEAKFVSDSYRSTGKHTGELAGKLTLFGVTKPVVINTEYIGGGKDPWGGHRQGFEGRLTLKPADFGKNFVPRLGQSSEEVELMLTVEGIRQSK